MLVDGEEMAYTEIYQRYWEKLFAISYNYCHSKELAEEIVQDIFMKLWDKRYETEIYNLPAYLATACKFSVYKHLLKQKRRKELLHQNTTDVQLTIDEEARIHACFLQNYINRIVEKLPPQCKAVFHYSRNEGLSASEIATHMQISTKTVESHLTKALKHIKLSLKIVKSFFVF